MRALASHNRPGGIRMMPEITVAMGRSRGRHPTRIRLERANVRLSLRLDKHQGRAPRRNPRQHVRSRGPLSETLAVRTHHIGSDRHRYLASRTSASARCHCSPNSTPTETTKTSGHVAEGRGGPDRHRAGEPDPHSVASRADAASPPNSMANPEPPARSSERPYRLAVCVYLVAAGLGWPRRGIAAHHSPDTRFA
jgi:hypothetical protein